MFFFVLFCFVFVCVLSICVLEKGKGGKGIDFNSDLDDKILFLSDSPLRPRNRPPKPPKHPPKNQGILQYVQKWKRR